MVNPASYQLELSLKNKTIAVLSTLAATALLSACGGGGGSSDTVPATGIVSNTLSVSDSALTAGQSLVVTSNAKAQFDALTSHTWKITQVSGAAAESLPTISDANCDNAKVVPGAKAGGGNPGVNGTSECTVQISVPVDTPTSVWLVENVAKSSSNGASSASFRLSVSAKASIEGGFGLSLPTAPQGVTTGTSGSVTAGYLISPTATLDKPVAYEWSKASGGEIVLTGASTNTLSFIATTAGDYVFTVKATAVINGKAVVREGAVLVRVLDASSALEVSAGDIMVATKGTVVTLNGSATNATAGNTLSYAWAVKKAPVGVNTQDVTLYNATTLKPQFTPTVSGDYEFELTVTQSGTSPVQRSATTKVSVQEPDQVVPAFTVSAGSAQVAQVNSVVTVAGSVAQGNPAPTNLTYLWTSVGAKVASLSGATTPTATFVPSVAGEYRLRFTATSGSVSQSDEVVISVGSAPAKTFQLSAGSIQSTPVSTPVSLTATLNGDVAAKDANIAWSVKDKNGTVVANVANSNTLNAGFVADVEGEYTATVTVTPIDGATPAKSATTLVLAYPATQTENAPPYFSITAGDAQVVEQGEVVLLSGEVVQGVPAAQNMSYSWTCDNGVVPSNKNALTASFIAANVGNVTCSLTVEAGTTSKMSSTSIQVLAPAAP